MEPAATDEFCDRAALVLVTVIITFIFVKHSDLVKGSFALDSASDYRTPK